MVKKSAKWSMTHLDYVLFSLLSFTLIIKVLECTKKICHEWTGSNSTSQNVHKVENAILNLSLSGTKYGIHHACR